MDDIAKSSMCFDILKILFGLSTVFLLLTDSHAASACNKPSQDILTSIVRVLNNDGSQASGVVISRDFVLTAAHVVEGDGPFYVKFDRVMNKRFCIRWIWLMTWPCCLFHAGFDSYPLVHGRSTSE